MKPARSFLVAVMLLAGATGSFAQPQPQRRTNAVVGLPFSPDGLWRAVERMPMDKGPPVPWLRPGKFRAFALNHGALRSALARAPKEFTPEARRNPVGLSLPLPDGTFARFRVVESPIMEPELAAKFPQIKTYCGQGVDEQTATVRFDLSPRGFHAQILSRRHEYRSLPER